MHFAFLTDGDSKRYQHFFFPLREYQKYFFIRPLSAYLLSSEMLIGLLWIDHLTDYDNQKINSNEQRQHREKLKVTDYLQNSIEKALREFKQIRRRRQRERLLKM